MSEYSLFWTLGYISAGIIGVYLILKRMVMKMTTHKQRVPFRANGGKAPTTAKKSAVSSVEKAFEKQSQNGGLVHIMVVHVPTESALTYMQDGPAAVAKAVDVKKYAGAVLLRNNVNLAETEFEDDGVSLYT